MKHFTKIAGIIACAVVIGFALASCGNGSTDSGGGGTRDPALVGTWTGDWITHV